MKDVVFLMVFFVWVVLGENTTEIEVEESSRAWQIQNELLTLRANVAEQNIKICELEKDIAKLIPKIPSGTEDKGGSYRTHFVRWGRKDCPGNVSELIYSGYAGGSYSTNTGAAVDYLCLPRDPVWGPHKDVVRSASGFVYGAEYKFPLVPGFNVHDVPCSVCLTTSYATSLMIPGRRECYPGWTLAYQGDLSSGNAFNTAASQYVCLDENIESIDDSERYEGGKMFFPVVAQCGSLPCPPYEQGKHLACAVCLK